MKKKQCYNPGTRPASHDLPKLDYTLTLKAPITTAADDKFCDIFPSFQQKEGMIFHENRLLLEDFHKLSCLMCYL